MVVSWPKCGSSSGLLAGLLLLFHRLAEAIAFPVGFENVDAVREPIQECSGQPFGSHDLKIERVILFYPYSSDQARLSKILKTLAMYRLAFGQPRQAELVENLLEHDFDEDEMKQILDNLMIDLSPINYEARTEGVSSP